ncbi:MAG: ferritin-like domain-containing protein [Ferruginibacter sp.]
MKTAEQSNTQQSTKANVKKKPMPVNSNEATGLRDLFEDGLKDIYWAEMALTKALPKMIDNATSPELINALTEHLAVTEEQVLRLEKIFSSVGATVQAKKCDAMEGLIKEGNQIMESTTEGVVRDAGIIAAGQKVEHYEIATYGTLCAFAKILGESEAADLLLQTLNEEKDADDKLSEVAEASINLEAAAEETDEELFNEEGEMEDEEIDDEFGEDTEDDNIEETKTK